MTMKVSTTGAVLTFALLLGTNTAPAQDTKDPIDKAMDACLAGPGGNNTVGQVDCAAKAAASWDRELNQVYQKLLKTLDPSSQTLLRNSQRQWLAFRDAEKKFGAGPWRAKQGTMVQVTLELVNVEILRSRVLTLRDYAGSGNPS
ncbi:MAG TPA: lysozyme inhibitor LprI family protein [Bryobacteraceae bacterium]|jgi:uncharacterized protein YecT (DUF1311 family)|nr:lysozyme inhibitor LprI family protein [Bryobacteraceae bacterium]